MKQAVGLSVVLAAAWFSAGCIPNDPYRPEESGLNVYYSTFGEPPKHLDPAVSYNVDEYSILGLIYEPPLKYHYLKRPYTLIPATAASVPEPLYLDRAGRPLPPGSRPEDAAMTAYEVRIKGGVMYQPHQCFARGADGSLLYHDLPPEMPGLRRLEDLPETGTRELSPADYVDQIKRLADPSLSPGCPILPVMAKYIVGMEEYAAAMRRDLERERARRREAGGPFYNAELDERRNPIRLDPDRHPLPGARVTGRNSYRITINGRYPQILYWLAMPFFCPMPREALSFYAQPALIARNIGLNRYPVGTGPYMMRNFDPNREIAMVRNPNFGGQFYPDRGEPGDGSEGLLRDAGKPIPFIDRVVLKLEKEAIPRWIKFMQGYYDASGIPSESFDQAVNFSPEGTVEISRLFKERGMRLEVEVDPTTYYFAFNMLDDTFGGYTEEKCMLRRAIAISMDTEERIQIFYNGRGVPAQSLIPPGIFGYEPERKGMDRFVYEWDQARGKPRRRSIEEARRLLADAGYPQGRNSKGEQLAIRFANAWTDPQSTSLIRWMEAQLGALGIRLINETTDYNRFQEKAQSGNYQLLHWGWHADYPDPENFLFLLYGPNGQVKHQGGNHSNYDRAEFNRIFKMLETMENTPRRLELIRRANAIAQHDVPLIWGFHSVSFGLYHSWLRNTKPSAIAYASLHYYRLDPEERARYRHKHNRPVLWPLIAGGVLLGLFGIPAVRNLRRRSAASPAGTSL